jgi:ubiquinone/menaquinone biosynthesis C-methylase UbiE
MTGIQSSNRTARLHVVDYYDHCRNDYRILWRTDENGSIHFGFFDEVDRQPVAWRGAPARAVRWCLSIFAAAAAGCLWLLTFGRGREAAIRCLRLAAGGRTTRHDAAQRRMTAVCAEMVAPRAGDRLLDAGCGVGGAGLWLAEQFGAHVYGVNVNHPQLRLSRRRAEGQPQARIWFSAQDYTEMGIADHTFDIVWGLESICHCEDKAAFVREAFRVLRDGGRLMVADFFQSRDSVSDADASRIRAWTKGWAIPNLASVDGFGACLAASGFTNITYRDIRRNVLPSSWRLYKASLVAEPIHRMLERTGFRSSIQGGNVRAARGQYETLSQGIWTYGIFVAEKHQHE